VPLNRYDAEIEKGILQDDVEQRAVMHKLDLISDELKRRKSWVPPSRSLFARWTRPTNHYVTGVQGLYLWGGVGRGKTHLCDLFFAAVPISAKTRLHFHRFMQQIHDDLRQLEGVDNPLLKVADNWATRSQLLLLDEIHVNDITDAMLLGGLMTALFERGVTLVTTSNVPPEGLYKNGLQRARFLPAIAQINKHTDVLEMSGETDYRLRILQKEPVYRIATIIDGVADQETRHAMQEYFTTFSAGVSSTTTGTTESIQLNSRELPVIGQASDVIWFDFKALCEGNRSTQDYIELASLYHTIMISDIPVMDENSNDSARRFVNMIDEFYDRHVKLIVSAEAAADQLYTGSRLAFEFERAASRLFEMQTTEYLGAQHRS